MSQAYYATIPAEDPNTFIGMWLDPVGLMHHAYDLDGDGKIELETVRRKTIFLLMPENTVLFTPPRWEEKPFIYYVDIDKNGRYEEDEMFLDRESDGINGNEEYLVS
ncbi:MAG TPA: hypothetical protein VI584_06760 [Nitrospiria bacterium]|nr:hypothetical protein [Nitrospiria bacterium]